MIAIETVRRSLGKGKIRPGEALNALIDLDNRRGLVGLWALEAELESQFPKLRPRAQALAKAWLQAIAAYRLTYYPEGKLAKLFARLGPKAAPRSERKAEQSPLFEPAHAA